MSDHDGMCFYAGTPDASVNWVAAAGRCVAKRRSASHSCCPSLVGEPSCVSYDSTKSAVLQLSRQMAIDFAKDGIRINCACPGWIDAGFNDPIFDDAGMSAQEIDDAVRLAIPLNRQGVPRRRRTLGRVRSDDGSYIAGTSLVIDGGFVAQGE
jgi:meso-butanediol dehydrogenase/(S,S)-butanediol dehydrogenase/diacetyl reductase